MKAKLIVVGGDAKRTEIDLKLPSVIGRGRSATLTLPFPLVSREHCEVYLAEGRLHVRDLGSLNGTYIGNEQIEDAVLPSGSLLTVGTVTFRAVYDDPAEEAAEDDLGFSVSEELDGDSDELTVGPDAPLSSRTTAMLTPGEAESSESESEALERILESLNEESPAEEVAADEESADLPPPLEKETAETEKAVEEIVPLEEVNQAADASKPEEIVPLEEVNQAVDATKPEKIVSLEEENQLEGFEVSTDDTDESAEDDDDLESFLRKHS